MTGHLDSEFWHVVVTSLLEDGAPRYFGVSSVGETCKKCGKSTIWKGYARHVAYGMAYDKWCCGICGFPHWDLDTPKPPTRPIVREPWRIRRNAEAWRVRRTRERSGLTISHENSRRFLKANKRVARWLNMCAEQGWLLREQLHDETVFCFTSPGTIAIPVDPPWRVHEGDVFYVAARDFLGL